MPLIQLSAFLAAASFLMANPLLASLTSLDVGFLTPSLVSLAGKETYPLFSNSTSSICSPSSTLSVVVTQLPSSVKPQGAVQLGWKSPPGTHRTLKCPWCLPFTSLLEFLCLFFFVYDFTCCVWHSPSFMSTYVYMWLNPVMISIRFFFMWPPYKSRNVTQ